MAMVKKSGAVLLTCTPKRLPESFILQASAVATAINPLNHPPVERLMRVMPGFEPSPMRIGAVTTKFWHTNGVNLTVGFLDNPEKGLRTKILSHMNAWAKTANVQFTESSTDPQVRIARDGGPNGGYWSFLGTDILSIHKDKPTMNLEGFTLQTEDSEFFRVVRHETGHTLAFPHEHMRRALVKKIDPVKAIKYYGQTQGWTPEEVQAQVLTPIEESSLLDPTRSDPHSIMCYQIPGIITKSGKPIIGGIDIDKVDFEYAAKVYPKDRPKAAKFPTIKKFHSGS